MFRFWIIFLLIFSVIQSLLPAFVVTAQQTPPSGPVYLVQEGDSLWEIADRFHVTQDDLAQTNGILNADQITVGQQLVIPGLEGIQEILTTQLVPYGENLQSLSIRYQLQPASLKRLNHITSPNELYAGYSLIIPQENISTTLGSRVSLDTGQSMLELAVLLCTPHSAEFRVPCIWTFLISLQSWFQRTTDYGQLTTDSKLQIPRVANRDTR